VGTDRGNEKVAAPILGDRHERVRNAQPIGTDDGANEFRVLFNIYIPLNWSIIWAMAIITFIGAWNNFLWPFIVTNSTPMLTVPVGMTQVQSAYGVAFAKTSAVAVMASIPTALAYLIFQKRVTQGSAETDFNVT
jgi:multiple sugar transport system permease protein